MQGEAPQIIVIIYWLFCRVEIADLAATLAERLMAPELFVLVDPPAALESWRNHPLVAIPAWTADGVLPPVDTIAPTSAERSPYPVGLVAVIDRYATSAPRMAILDGFLRYRAALHANGYQSGFQWLDGSFMEHVELLQGRAPKDLDVVSFLDDAQPGATPDAAQLRALDHAHAKADFVVDSYFVELEQVTPRELSAQCAYWYSMWAHRRDFTWKGFLQVDLAPAEDSAARLILAQNMAASAGNTP